MSSPAKKRSIADFFQPKARERLNFNLSGSQVIPQKRPSPTPEIENIPPLKTTDGADDYTPPKRRVKAQVRTPKSPTYSPISLPRSGSLPIRSQFPKSTSKPAKVYKSGRIFDASSRSSTPSVQRQKPVPPKKTPAAVTFANVDDLPTSTLAVVKQGKVVAVRDSDEDDSDSLLSLDEIFGTKRADDSTSLSSPPDVEEDSLEAERKRMLSLFTKGRSEESTVKNKLRALEAKSRVRDRDMSKFVEDHLKEQAEEERIRQSREQYEKSMKALESDSRQELDIDLLTSMVQSTGGDEEDVARLLNAVSRTEALSSERYFSFFGAQGLRDLDKEPRQNIDFPNEPSLKPLFKSYDDAGRKRTYLSGFMSELAGVGQLSDAVFQWTFGNVLNEKDNGLRQSYIGCLKRGSPHYTRTTVDVQDVQKVFERLGAGPTTLKDAIESRHQSLRKAATPSFKYLLDVLELFEGICQHMDFVALTSLVSIACRLAVDEELMSHAPISCKVESFLQTLINMPDKDMRGHVSDCILKDMSQHLDAPTLQSQLLTHILPITPTSSGLRVRLALTFLLGPNATTLQTPITSAILPILETHILTSPTFDTSLRNARAQNYTHLRFRTTLLDTAIANGHRPASFATKADETHFNRTVDALADTIKSCFVSISDSGASHLTRTEAKDALTALYWRVLVGVRTKPRVKKHVFDAEGTVRDGEVMRGEEGSRRQLRGWLVGKKGQWAEKGKEKAKRREKDGGGEEDSEVTSSYASAREEFDF